MPSVERGSFLARACGGDTAAMGRLLVCSTASTMQRTSFALLLWCRGMPVRKSAPTACCGNSAKAAAVSSTWPSNTNRSSARLRQNHQARHGHAAGDRPLRGRAAGAGADGSSEHRQGVRRRRDRDGPAVLRDGAGARRPITEFCDQHQLVDRGAAGAVHPGLPRGAARASEGHHPPRHQAVERAGHAARRHAGVEGHRLRHRQGDQGAADRARRCSPQFEPVDRHARLHEPGAGGDGGLDIDTRSDIYSLACCSTSC